MRISEIEEGRQLKVEVGEWRITLSIGKVVGEEMEP